jgi:PIN domain nuclease of toxin-antitoxin system
MHDIYGNALPDCVGVCCPLRLPSLTADKSWRDCSDFVDGESLSELLQFNCLLE